jgi:hypothetical protein
MELLVDAVKRTNSHAEGIVNLYYTYNDINSQELSWNPKNTFVIMVSILEYENSNLAGWDKSTRRCKNLYEVLKKIGVSEENIYYLKEIEADTVNFKLLFKNFLQKCERL